MASKGKVAGKLGKNVKKAGAKKQEYAPFLKVIIPAASAVAAPPLGPQLAQRGVQIASFCKDFNALTAEYKPKVPMIAEVKINVDRTYSISLVSPPTSYFLKQAAGMKKGAMKTGQEVAGKLSLKHIYEIAKIKETTDNRFRGTSLEAICKTLIGQCHDIGIEVVRDLKPENYGKFLEERQQIVQEQEEALEAKRQAKLLRT
ncbi:large ribosomal subunit protein uL11m-like [Saccostrea echinata]|uniref:large ribosomal subunit protein uL11m-like n=1 Tax=Saccostrea echinata TaxID=191078 RepID=UPI002A82A459|nr:large ribosomal subunit protein uL11m-like [Saccostrea echinata]